MEINEEQLKQLSVADLSGLITLDLLYPSKLRFTPEERETLLTELKSRTNNIFIN